MCVPKSRHHLPQINDKRVGQRNQVRIHFGIEPFISDFYGAYFHVSVAKTGRIDPNLLRHHDHNLVANVPSDGDFDMDGTDFCVHVESR